MKLPPKTFPLLDRLSYVLGKIKFPDVHPVFDELFWFIHHEHINKIGHFFGTSVTSPTHAFGSLARLDAVDKTASQIVSSIQLFLCRWSRCKKSISKGAQFYVAVFTVVKYCIIRILKTPNNTISKMYISYFRHKSM